MKEVFLICALALVPINFQHQPSIKRQYQDLRDFIHKVHPGAEIFIIPHDIPLPVGNLERLPFDWHGMSVWINRRPEYDRRKVRQSV